MAPKATGPRPAPPVPPADPERRGPASREAVVATAKRPWRRPMLRWVVRGALVLIVGAAMLIP